MIDSEVVKEKERATREIASINTNFEYLLIPSNEVEKVYLD
nr:hypothetical protein [Fusobacterium mortiferum]